ncbi:MAG: electron transfer flavoprotein subunit beta/FixA family protein [Burkholderiales bacterium]
MRIAVLVKQVPNPEALGAVLRVDEDARKVVLPPGHPMVMSPFDEQALEAALRIRDQLGTQVGITALTLGPESARTALKQALSLGADDAVHLLDPAFDGADSYVTAHALEAALRQLGPVDLVLAGRQAADWDAGVVALGVAEILGLPSIGFACAVEASTDSIRVERVLPDGLETFEAALPAVVTVSNELGEVRKPNLRETMRAARKPVATWSAAEIGLEARQLAARRTLARLYLPQKRAQCEWIEAATAAERGARLAQRLYAEHLIPSS